MVAASLGHTSFTTTARHYAQPQAVRHAKTERVLAVLDPQATRGHDQTTEPTLPAEPNSEVIATETQEGVSTHVVAEFIAPTFLSSRLPSIPMASPVSPLSAFSLAVSAGESPLITWLSILSRRKRPRALGPYKNNQGYRLVVFDGSQRKSVVFSTLEQAEALRAQIVTVINRSQNLPAPDKPNASDTLRMGITLDDDVGSYKSRRFLSRERAQSRGSTFFLDRVEGRK